MLQTRRHFFGTMAKGIGGLALGSLIGKDFLSADSSPKLANGLTDLAPKAKRIIYLFQSGGPSPQDLFDHKPYLQKHNGEDLRDHIEMTQRVTGMTANQASFPIAGTHYNFDRYGQSGAEISELLPYTAQIADDICIVRNMYTEAINHDPAVTFFQTGSQIAGRPSMGAWLSYGLGTSNKDLPNFVAMVSRGSGRPNCQPLYDRLWGSGFLPTEHAGVKFMSIGDPVLYLRDPKGMSKQARRKMLDHVAHLNQNKLDEFGDPEIYARIQQYELAYRMQTSVPELSDISDEPKHVLEMYGPDVTQRGSYAYNCLMARRLAERGVQFTQLYHMGWDQHFTLPKQLPGQCRDTDQASAALVKDLKQRGMLDDTLVVWGGEFGRTSYSQGKLTKTTYGRDHHPRCFPIWMAGGGVKPGITHGQTDKLGYNIVDPDGNPVIGDKHHYSKHAVHVHDLQATMMHLMGVDHEKLTFKFQGRNFRLTDVHGHVVNEILA
ncbi:DUF1501 domain-containing protein [Rubritalea tangerina]|uniref:DUF1501 domain-containing protein n=2 Tax=Rubritalea tangerina TaxID=430798 RepID=A0ABW4Z8N0_9BACT